MITHTENEILEKLETIKSLIDEGNLSSIKPHLKGNPPDIALLINNLEPSQKVIIFRLLPKDEAVEVFEHLDVEEQSDLLSGFVDERILGMVDAMSPDDRARLFDELPAKVVKKLLSRMTPEEWKSTSVLLGFDEGTAGRIMTPEYVNLKMDMTTEEALDYIKRVGHAKETVYNLYVIDNTRHLIGVVSLRKIVLAEKSSRIEEIMNSEVIKVTTEDDQEDVARVIRDYDFLAVPVVDKEGMLVGIVTVDDIVDVIEEEATEDMFRMGGVETADKGYFRSSIMNNLRKRMGWLVLLLCVNTLTGIIILHQKRLLEGVIVLSAFIPILIGSGGNAGAQSSTVVIRGLAIGEIEQRDAIKILLREIFIGIGLGILLGFVATLWAQWLQGEWSISVVVGLSFVSVITFATTLGTFLPMIVKRIGLDPALMATPFITTAIDVTALLIYFEIARRLLGL